MKYVQTRGLVCSADGLKILVNVGEGFLGVFLIPLGPVLPVEVIIMLSLSGMLEVKVVDILVGNCVEHSA